MSFEIPEDRRAIVNQGDLTSLGSTAKASAQFGWKYGSYLQSIYFQKGFRPSKCFFFFLFKQRFVELNISKAEKEKKKSTFLKQIYNKNF